MMVDVNVVLSVDGDRLWLETFGGGWEYSSVPVRVRFLEGASWKEAGFAKVSILDPDDENRMTTKVVDVQMLADAYGKMIASGYHHCGASLSLDSFDSCASFDLLQVVLFGELIYG